jgi:hypothetical protein
MKRKIWNFAELLTYDYLMYLDKGVSPELLKKRDRKIYLNSGANRKTDSRRLARVWFEAMLTQAESFPAVIQALLKARRLLTPIIIAVGLFIGISYGLLIMKYNGSQAINLAPVLFLLVLVPLFFNLVSIVTVIFKNHFRGVIPAGFMLLIVKKLSRVYSASEEKRRSGTAFLNDLAVRLKKYGAAPVWLATVRINLYSLTVVIGILLAVIFSGLFHDLAFTWQTVTDLKPQTVESIVKVVSLPWHSLAPQAVPSLENIAGSRGVLKDGITMLNNENLASWWSFLCFAILFYAVIPRALILLVSVIAEKISFANIKFSEADSLSLFRRMRSPLLDSGTETFVADSPLRDRDTLDKTAIVSHYHNKTVFSVFIPDDIKIDGDEKITAAVEKDLHGICNQVSQVILDESRDDKIWDSLPADNSAVLILEGWQPCTREYIEYVAAMRKNLGSKKLIVIGLIGNCSGDENSSQGGQNDLYKDWQYQLSSLRDPALEVIKFNL